MINFNELLANELSEFLSDNQDWFLLKDYGGVIYGIDKGYLAEAIKDYFKQHEQPIPALLRKKE